MKITFTTPLTDTNGNALAAAALATATYLIFIDTVNPPLASFPVPQANLDAGVVNPDGSKTVVVDAVTDLKFAPVDGTTYFVAAEDSVSGISSAESGAVQFTFKAPVITPVAPGNLSVA